MGVGNAEKGNLFRARGLAPCKSCLLPYGNEFDPYVEFHWVGPHVSGFLKIDLIAVAYGKSTEGVEEWINMMTTAEGKDYVFRNRFNCDGKYQEMGLRLLKDAEVYSIIIRRDPRPVDPFFDKLCGGR